MKYLLLVLSVVIPIVLAAKLPSYYTKCKKNDPELNACLLKNANDGMAMFAIGDEVHHIQSISPLDVPYFQIDVKGNLIINFYNTSFIGIDKSVFEVLNFDFEKQSINMVFFMTKLNMQGQYDINGRILILPIVGEGPVNVTYENIRVTYNFDYELLNRKGKEYMNLKSTKLSYETTRAHFHLGNLFNGDKRLGSEMGKFLNENWKEVDGEIGEKLGDAMRDIISILLTNFFNKVPFSEFFS